VFEEVLRILRSKYPDLKIGIISGAPSFVVAHFKDVFGLDFAIADNLIDFQSGTVSMYKDKSGDDKFLILKDVSLEYGYELDECMHVGDGMNDVGIFEATGNGVTFNWCGDKVKEKAKYVISEFSELEQLLDL
jgi:phosphoserine phosphatase